MKSTIDNPQPAICGGTLVYWLLVLMGLSTFAPCVLLPEWRAYQALMVSERAQELRLEELRRVVDRERRLLEAMRSDPAVTDRLAQRDLKFHRPGERAVRVSLPVTETVRRSLPAARRVAEVPPILEPQPPLIVVRALSFLPDLDYDRVFCDKETRPIVMCMSVALIALALGLFTSRRTP